MIILETSLELNFSCKKIGDVNQFPPVHDLMSEIAPRIGQVYFPPPPNSNDLNPKTF